MFIAFGLAALYFGRNLQMGSTVRMGPGYVPHMLKNESLLESGKAAPVEPNVADHKHELIREGSVVTF